MEAHCTQFTATMGQELKCMAVRTILTPETGKEKGKRQAKIKDKVDGGQSKNMPKKVYEETGVRWHRRNKLQIKQQTSGLTEECGRSRVKHN